ncbi:MAG: PAS domain S-box protein [Desulfatibacillaceae bacterium]
MAGRSFRNVLAMHGILWSTLPLLLVGLATLAVLTAFLEREITGKNLLLAQSLASEVEQWLVPQMSILAQAGDVMRENGPVAPERLDAYLESVLRRNSLFETIQIIDEAGKVLHSAPPRSRRTGADLTSMDFLGKFDFGPTRGLTSTFKSTGADMPLLVLTRTIPGGVAVGYLNLHLLNDIVGKVSLGKTGFAVVLDENGNVLARPDGKPQSLPGVDSMRELRVDHGLREGRAHIVLNGERVLATAAAVSPTRWAVVVTQREDEAFTPVRHLTEIFLVGLCLTLVFSFGVSVWLSGRLTRPLQTLSRYSKRLAMGEYDAHISRHNYGEVDTLARDLEAMAEAIRLRETALRESEERYRTILDGIEDAYYETNLEGDLVFFNDKLCEILGYSGRELLGMNNREYSDPEHIRKTFESFNQVFRTGKPATGVEWRIVTKEGQKRDLEVSVSLIRDRGEKVGFRGIVRDVTERRAMEAELSQTKNFLQNIMLSSIDTIVSTDLAGNIEFATPSVFELLGYTPHQMMARKVEYYYVQGREDARKIMRGLRETGGMTNHEMQVRRRDGRIIDVNLSASFLRNERGQVIGTLGVLRDVSYNKRLEAHLQHAQKMEAIGTLAGGVAHDFNNLLMGVQGYVSLMLLDMDRGHPLHDKLRKIEQHVTSGAELTKQLLGVARGGKYEVKPKNPNDLVSNTAEMFGRTRKEIRIHTRFDAGVHTVDVDRGQIEQVLLNLFVNAWQAMPDGGDLYIETKNVFLDAEFTGPFDARPGPFARISVRDTGHGMDAETCTKVFDPFFTTKEKGRGTGLGLASAYGIMKNHNGMITVQSEKGRGSTFNLYIPASRGRATAVESVSADVRRGTETVLLVDDEAMVLDVGAQMLRALGYRVLEAGSGVEAADIFRERHEEIDVVILDMIMPGMGGEETYELLREIDPGVKVLLCSGYSIRGQASHILEKGCNAFVQKPFDITTLSAALNEVLGPRGGPAPGAAGTGGAAPDSPAG